MITLLPTFLMDDGSKEYKSTVNRAQVKSQLQVQTGTPPNCNCLLELSVKYN